MPGEPRNAASDRWRAEIPRWADGEYVRSQARRQLADSFVRTDRRRLIAIPTTDADEYIRHFLTWFDIGDGNLEIKVSEVVAVRGDRLLLCRMTNGYPGGPERATLALAQYSEDLEQCQKLTTFDLDDLDAAIAELDELHQQLESDGA